MQSTATTKKEKTFSLDLDLEFKEEWLKIINKVEEIGVNGFLDEFNTFNLDKSLYRDIVGRRENAAIKDLKLKLSRITSLYEGLNERFNDLLLCKSELQVGKVVSYKEKEKIEHESTAIILWSDFHVGEHVKLEQTFGLNEFNKNIAEQRVNKLAINTVKLLKKEKKDSKIKNILLHLGGDFIGGWIHEELSQTNFMSPVEETLFAAKLLGQGIEHLLKYSDCPITIICSRGNHARTTKKMQFANEVGTSYETLLYSILSERFKEKITFYIEESGIGYVNIYDFKIRYYHGHQIKYLGGVGGMTIPLNKWQQKQDQTTRADFNLMGHFHQLSYPNSTTILNGSLKGYDAYCVNLGLPFEPPQQAFVILDSKYGLTGRFPIRCF